MLTAGAPVETFDEIDSTILEARRRAEFGDYGPVWLVARRQNAGRGRRGRTWASPPGNLYVTYLGRTGRAPGEIALLGFAAGLAIAEALDEAFGAASGAPRARLKWPNDVLVEGGKISGIMLDSGASQGGVPGGHWFALGFGVNVVSAPQGIDQKTASLRDFAAHVDAATLFADIRPRLERWAARLEAEGFAPLRDAWTRRAHGLDAPAEVRFGEETISGVLKGLSVRGELEIMTSAGPRVVAAGDVHFPQTTAALF
jgi:BirA family biotin operon repressor/biotin-[acetyl-CoA-carboxylase] ligase